MNTTTVPEGPPYHPYHLPAPVIIPSLPHEALLYWIFKQFLAFLYNFYTYICILKQDG